MKWWITQNNCRNIEYTYPQVTLKYQQYQQYIQRNVLKNFHWNRYCCCQLQENDIKIIYYKIFVIAFFCYYFLYLLVLPPTHYNTTYRLLTLQYFFLRCIKNRQQIEIPITNDSWKRIKGPQITLNNNLGVDYYHHGYNLKKIK